MCSGIGGVPHTVAVHAVPCRAQPRRALQKIAKKKKTTPGLAMTAMRVRCAASSAGKGAPTAVGPKPRDPESVCACND
jgi:hypothetical protein